MTKKVDIPKNLAILNQGILGSSSAHGSIDGLIITKTGVIYFKAKKQAKKA